MARRKSFDPLAELMKEFGSTARLGKKTKRGSPKFDRKYGRGEYDPQGSMSIGPYGARRSIPTNRRNPGRKARMNPNQMDFAAKSREAANLMRQGMSRKQAWSALKNPREFHAYHSSGPTTMDFSSPYELRRGAYGPGRNMPPVNRRNPSMKKMGGPQLEALANQGDPEAYEEIERRAERRERRQSRRGDQRSARHERRQTRRRSRR